MNYIRTDSVLTPSFERSLDFMDPPLIRRDVSQIRAGLFNSHSLRLPPRALVHLLYRPLHGPPDAMRLIVLKPAPFTVSPIHCRVIETSWEAESEPESRTKHKSNSNLTSTTSPSPKGYTALSYTWGSSTPPTPITIDGRPFKITTSTPHSSQHLRSPRKEVHLWADSLCID